MNHESEEPEDELDREAITKGLTEMGFQSAESLAQLAGYCQRVIPRDDADPSEVVEGELTKLGGVPDVHADFQWPTNNGAPLAFLAQLDFYADGALVQFFYDTENRPSGMSPSDCGGWKVLRTERKNVQPATLPTGLPKESQFPEQLCTLVGDITLPDSKSGYMSLDELPISESDVQMLRELEDNDIICHQFLGHPALLQGDMEVPIQLAFNGIDPTAIENLGNPDHRELVDRSEEWCMLFQVDSDSNMNWDWADNGMLFYWIRQDDLAALDFENTWAVLQSH